MPNGSLPDAAYGLTARYRGRKPVSCAPRGSGFSSTSSVCALRQSSDAGAVLYHESQEFVLPVTPVCRASFTNRQRTHRNAARHFTME